MTKTKIIVVAGPTASGKTALGIEIAKAVSGEIISADSMQIYKDLGIASAAPTEEERAKVKHHLVEEISLEEEYSVADFCERAAECVKEITEHGHVPVIVGGTGLFIDSFADNISFLPIKGDKKLRESLDKKSTDELYDMLLKEDSKAAEDIHPNNRKRVIRALEICMSGSTKTNQNEESKKGENPYETLYFVLEFKDRAVLYDRIDKRVDKMFEDGLLKEAEEALKKNGQTSVQAIGPKELIPYFRGELSLEEAGENIKKQTRHYAKRQITWFKRRQGAVFLEADEQNEMLKKAIKISREFLNE